MASLPDLEKLLVKIKAGVRPRFLLIYGDQDYLVKQAYDRVLEALVPSEIRAFNLEQLDGTQVDLESLLAAWEIVPMMPGPKALGIPDARFFQSKSNGVELLERSKSAWAVQDVNLSLRQLARVLSLLEWTWEEAQGKGIKDFLLALDSDDGAESAGGPWLERALVQGMNSAFPLPRASDESEELLEALRQNSASGEGEVTRTLVFASASADARKKLYRFLQEEGQILDFKAEGKGAQNAQTASAFLKGLLTQRQLSMSSEFQYRFGSLFGHDLGLMVRELDKMEAWAFPRKELNASDFQEVGSPQPEDNIFQLFDALARRSNGLKDAMLQLQRLLESEPPEKIFSMLVGEIRLLQLCRALVDSPWIGTRLPAYIPYKTGLHLKLCNELPAGLAAFWKSKSPYALHKTLERAKQFSPQELRSLMQELLEADLRMKSSESKASEELQRLCVKVAGVREEEFL